MGACSASASLQNARPDPRFFTFEECNGWNWVGSKLICKIPYDSYIPFMEWEVEYTNEFEQWWQALSEAEQVDVAASVALLEKLGPSLPFPHSSAINRSRHSRMRELRVQHQGRPYC